MKRFFSIIMLFCVISTSLLSTTSFVNAATPVTISLSYDSELIPTSPITGWAIVSGGKVLYRVTVKATIYGYGTHGHSMTFNDPNTSTVKYVGNSGIIMEYGSGVGTCYAFYEVRGLTPFSCTASINDGSFVGSSTSTITPQEACTYQSDFYITCYWTALESDYSGSYNTSMPGLSGLYKSNFVTAVRTEGSGYSHYNQYIRYNTSTGIYEYGNPVTASNTTPIANRTIAVDNRYIPRVNISGTGWLRGTVSIAGGVGQRIAEDSGGAINYWDIDVYTGLGIASASNKSFDCTNQTVNYLGNNKM